MLRDQLRTAKKQHEIELLNIKSAQAEELKRLQSLLASDVDKRAYFDLENNMKLLHPFMPFLTEEIWHLIADRTKEEALIVSTWPEIKPFNAQLIADFENTIEVISGIRTIRKEKNIAFKDVIDLKVINNENTSTKFDAVILKLGNIESLEYVSEAVEGTLTYRVKSNEYFIPIAGNIDVAAEIEKLEAELKYTQGFLRSVQGKLSNEKFVQNVKIG